MMIPEISLDALQSFEGRLFLIGRLRSGKDHLSSLLKRPQWGLADAMRVLLKGLNYPSDKRMSGARECLMKIGQWGRGWVDSNYPLSPERIMWVDYIRNHGSRLAPQYDWSNYGLKPTFYSDLILQDPKYQQTKKSMVSDIRFQSDALNLQEAGSALVLVWASHKTICRRIVEIGEVPVLNPLFDCPGRSGIKGEVLSVDAAERYSTYWTLWFQNPTYELEMIQDQFLPRPDHVYLND